MFNASVIHMQIVDVCICSPVTIWGNLYVWTAFIWCKD